MLLVLLRHNSHYNSKKCQIYIYIYTHTHTYRHKSRLPLKDETISTIATNKSIMYRDIIAVCSEISTEHKSYTVWAERRFI